jgi:hypothetical protein
MVRPWREPARAARLARVLWAVWAVVVWNVVFDRVLVLAGREFVHTASVSARESGRFLHAAEWMRPAIAHGLILATAAAAAILIVGLVAVPIASRRSQPQGPK